MNQMDDYLGVCMFPTDAQLVCAVSGGADSAALLLLAHRYAQIVGADVSAIHIDHGLRLDSASDADHVAELTDRLGVSLTVERVEIVAGPNLEERSRIARHTALASAALGHKVLLDHKVLLGHTADDRAETVLLQLIRGGALDALASMRATSTRPILALRRTDTAAICAIAGYEPISDPANSDPRFVRNRIRHEALPLLDEISQRDVTLLLERAAALAAEEADLLNELAAVIDPTDARALTAAPRPLARRAVRAWLRADARQQHPPDAAAVQRVLAVAAGEQRATQTNDGRRVSRHRGRLMVGEKPTDRSAKPTDHSAKPADRSAKADNAPQSN